MGDAGFEPATAPCKGGAKGSGLFTSVQRVLQISAFLFCSYPVRSPAFKHVVVKLSSQPVSAYDASEGLCRTSSSTATLTSKDGCGVCDRDVCCYGGHRASRRSAERSQLPPGTFRAYFLASSKKAGLKGVLPAGDYW